MNHKRYALILLAGIVCIALFVGITAYGQNIETGETGAPTYQYAAKYVCGLTQDISLKNPVLPGAYRTTINVHNPQTANVSIKKKAVESSREVANPIPPGRLQSYIIQPDYSFEIDCDDINSLRDFPSSTLFSEGFVIIQSPRQIDVIALYTAGSAVTTGSNVVTMEVETIEPKISVPVATQYVDISS